MTTSGLATPPRAAPRRPPRRRPEALPLVPQPPRRRTSFERVLAWSLGLSILAHVLLLLLSPLFIQTVNPPGGAVASAPEASGSFGMEMIVAIPSENAPETPPVERTPVTEQPAFRPPAAAPSAPSPGAAAPGAAAPGPPDGAVEPSPTPGSGLRPGARDPRLYVRPNPLGTIEPRSGFNDYMEDFRARVDAVNDSMGIAAARNRRTTDWTVTDGDGNKWGLSPDGLHLGGITIPSAVIPLPAPTGDNASREAERERQRQREEIQRQEAERERRDTQRERSEATQAEQDARRQAGGGN